VARFGKNTATSGQLGVGWRLQVTNQKRSVALHCRLASEVNTYAAEVFVSAKCQTSCLVYSLRLPCQQTQFVEPNKDAMEHWNCFCDAPTETGSHAVSRDGRRKFVGHPSLVPGSIFGRATRPNAK